MIECESKIAQVTVYPGQARVVRRGQVEVSAGSVPLLLPDLPLALLPESVRVSARGTARVRLLGVEVRKTRYAAPPEEELAGLDAQIEQLEDDDRALADRLSALNNWLQVLAGLAQSAPERLVRGFTWGRVGLDKVESLLTFVHRAEIEAQGQIRQVEVRRRELGRALERLRRLRQDRQQPDRPDRYAVQVPVEVLEGGSLELTLRYVCQGANWEPLYDLRLEEGADGVTLHLSQLAQVSQQTGEDWAGVELAVSTARPALAARLPELKPWYIDLYHPAPARTARKMAMAAPAPPAGSVEGAAVDDLATGSELEEEVEVEVVAAEVREEGPAIVFVAPGRTSIPADGSVHKVLLGSEDLSARLDWVTAPKVEAHVYRRARMENTTAAVLLAGPANLFYGDTFVGSTTLPETPAQGEVEIYLGVDDQVKVEREQLERTVDKSGLLDKVRRILYAYRITVHNHRQERVGLTVLDQVPTSRHEDLKVRLLRSDPEVEPGEMGELRWSLGLAGGEEREVRFTFQVDMPLDRQAVGLA